MSAAFLKIENLEVRYGNIAALKNASLGVNKGELVAVIGSNGAGKTTLMKTISGVLRPHSGRITLQNSDLGGLAAHKVAALGVAHCPEGRKIFATQTVEDNLLLGAYLRCRSEGRKALRSDVEKAFDTFPILRERRSQIAGTLSGGEQQMLAIARALISKPQLLLLDEPSMGLAPIIIDEVFRVIKGLRDSGDVTVLLVEQLAYRALKIADRAYVLEQGEVRLTGTGAELLVSPEVQRAYLGANKRHGIRPATPT
jgi:branched-chain amino acid transport system ATP-binding protein